MSLNCHKSLVVETFNNGIKILEQHTTQQTMRVEDLLNLPLNVIFLDPACVIQNIN